MSVLGKLWCPACFACRTFNYVDDLGRDTACWCDDCGYVHDKIREELPGGETRVRPVIPPDLAAEAKAKVRREFEASALSSGYRRENFTHGRKT